MRALAVKDRESEAAYHSRGFGDAAVLAWNAMRLAEIKGNGSPYTAHSEGFMLGLLYAQAERAYDRGADSRDVRDIIRTCFGLPSNA